MKIWIVVADEREALFYDAGAEAGADGDRLDHARAAACPPPSAFGSC